MLVRRLRFRPGHGVRRGVLELRFLKFHVLPGEFHARCTFSSCKFTGADLLEAVLSRVEVRDSSFAYASVAKGKLEDVSVRSTDFSGADLAELRQRRVEFDDVRFAGTSFFRASLNGVDLSSCRLADIVLSDTMEELRGCSMDLFQAAGIARRLGVNVKD